MRKTPAKIVFCGTFEAKGAAYDIDDKSISIQRYGEVLKLVKAVDQITFSGQQALASGQQVLCVTERAVFELTEAGMCLRELAPGIDLQKDVLERMAFAPVVPSEIPQMPLFADA